MPVPQGLPSLSPMGEEFPLFWSLDMMRLGSSVFFVFLGVSNLVFTSPPV